MARLQISVYYLQELNYRLAYTIFGTALLFSITYTYKQGLVFIFIPQGLSHFVSTGLTEIFFTYLELCTLLSAGFSIAIVLIQLYLFLRPGLYVYESQTYLNILLCAISFYLCLYAYAFPNLVQALWQIFSTYSQNFTPIHLSFEPKLDDYMLHLRQLNNILSISFPCVLALNIIQKYTTKKLWVKYRGIAYLSALTFAAFITPPDILSQAVIGFPLIIFYEVQIVCWAVFNKYQSQLLIGQPIEPRKNTDRQYKKGQRHR